MVKIIPYNPNLKRLAQKLRKDMTPGEVLLWKELKDNKFHGFDFDRQRCIDNYIVDFYCKTLQLAIEVDGMSHNGEEAFNKDALRQKRLESLGVNFIRFSESEIKSEILNVIRALETVMIDLIKGDPTLVLPANFDKSILNS
ncbi:endonuclease domain-containing protein [Mucilaginibacter antarcticus]|uniref:Endonuclease domain-containing protein n=1 Tax=Mucilaginibacter antarcticus TaxID=1855725 RepID=A0ABW5XSF1_9SPHI